MFKHFTKFFFRDYMHCLYLANKNWIQWHWFKSIKMNKVYHKVKLSIEEWMNEYLNFRKFNRKIGLKFAEIKIVNFDNFLRSIPLLSMIRIERNFVCELCEGMNLSVLKVSNWKHYFWAKFVKKTPYGYERGPYVTWSNGY